MKKTYFISPNFDIAPPPDGPLKLGHIIPGPDEPDIEPLNSDSHIEVPNPLPPTIQKGFSTTRERLFSGELGLWAQIMATVGVHAGAGFSRSANDEISMKEVETQTFQPRQEYVEKSIAKEDVSQFLKYSEYKVPVYMITGLKIARGASMRRSTSSSVSASGEVDVPLDAAQLGPRLKFSRGRDEQDSFSESSDFVLAFRIQRIRFHRVDGKPEIRDRSTFVRGVRMLDDAESPVQLAESPRVLGLGETADELPGEVEVLDGIYVDEEDDGSLCEFWQLR